MTTQPLQALRAANTIRFHRAEVKREISQMLARPGRAKVAQLIREAPAEWETCRLEYLLQMPAYVGHATCTRWCRAINTTGNRQLGQLTERQRELLAHLVEEPA